MRRRNKDRGRRHIKLYLETKTGLRRKRPRWRSEKLVACTAPTKEKENGQEQEREEVLQMEVDERRG